MRIHCLLQYGQETFTDAPSRVFKGWGGKTCGEHVDFCGRWFCLMDIFPLSACDTDSRPWGNSGVMPRTESSACAEATGRAAIATICISNSYALPNHRFALVGQTWYRKERQAHSVMDISSALSLFILWKLISRGRKKGNSSCFASLLFTN